MILDDFINIRKKINSVNISSNEIIGSFAPEAADIKLLKNLVASSCLEEFVSVSGKHLSIGVVTPGIEITIKLYPLRLSVEKYYENIEVLLKASSQIYPNDRFYVHYLNFDSSITNKPIEIENFYSITKLIEFLKDIADYKEDRRIIFFQSKKLILSTDYTFSKITSLIDVDSLISHVSFVAVHEERKKIFINELFESLIKIPEEKDRFNHFLVNFNEIHSNYSRSHRLYLEKYSYTKFKSELESERLDYIRKIQSVINDAQTKLVAIPVAFLLIIGQFDISGDRLFFNSALVLSAIVFSALFEVLIKNQFSAMKFIEEDIDRFDKSIDEQKKLELGNEFPETLTKIRDFYGKQICYLKIIRVLVWSSPFMAFLLFIASLFNLFTMIFFKNIFWITINVANKIIC